MPACIVVKIIDISDIPNSKKKWVVLTSDGNDPVTVVTGDHYENGQPGIFIPEGAIVPEKLLREMWLWNDLSNKGRLAGKKGNRVKIRKIDGVVSNGLFYGAYYLHEGACVTSPSWNPLWGLGQDVTQEIGVTFQ